jgi:phosphoribosylamine--glycine ligase
VREAIAALARFGPPWVVKQDGLAAGKGVTVTEAREAAEAAVREALAGGSGAVVLEQFLAGEEASLMAVCDGTHFLMLPPARDFKRALDGDRGPNTGGMGAFAPSTQVSAALEAEVGERVVRPVLQCLLARGTPFTGTLYVGLMLGESGPRVVEFNARFGDPEAEVVLPLLEGSPATLLASAARGALQAGAVQRGSGAAVGVVIAAEGYPEAPKAGGRIVGLERLMERDDLLVFHAGTAWNDGWRVHGGRAVHVVACGATPAEARARVYEGIATLGGEGWRCRGDIAAAAAGADAHLRPAGAR